MKGPACGPSMTQSDQDYQSESDHGTLSRAADIQSSTSRVAGAAKFHRKQTKKMSSVGKLFGGKR